MSPTPKLYFLLFGCKPQGRHTEQHDVFFGIGETLKELVPAMHAFWPEAKKNLHVDAWREVNTLQNYTIRIRLKTEASSADRELKLFFINLGGYKKEEFEEYHHKLLIVAKDLPAAVAQAKQEIFYKTTGFKGASAHIDDKYGIDVDEAYEVEELLPKEMAARYALDIVEGEGLADEVQLGYLPLWKIK
ncbi:MAG: hypothetical protein K0R51_1551 [Cytophagaceae bacterium]|jgi:hypothetical protein|nr:hypothetical protein [Cytophagaceae bacterium]